MTTLIDFERLRDMIADARAVGFTFKHSSSHGWVDVHACAETYPGLVNNVRDYHAPHIEDALRFVDGVRWYRLYLRIRGEMK
jgi:hypothetical protein